MRPVALVLGIPSAAKAALGREMGAEVLNNYTEVKAVTIKL